MQEHHKLIVMTFNLKRRVPFPTLLTKLEPAYSLAKDYGIMSKLIMPLYLFLAKHIAFISLRAKRLAL